MIDNVSRWIIIVEELEADLEEAIAEDQDPRDIEQTISDLYDAKEQLRFAWADDEAERG